MADKVTLDDLDAEYNRTHHLNDATGRWESNEDTGFVDKFDPNDPRYQFGHEGYNTKIANDQKAFEQGIYDPLQSKNYQSLMDSYLAKYGSRAAPTATAAKLGSASTYGGATAAGTTIDTSQDATTRAYQMDLLSKLKAQAEGTGPSLAGIQLKQGLEQNLMQQQAAAASLRGRGSAGMAMRSLGNAGAGMAATTNAQAASAKVAEQLGAMSQLGAASSAARGMDQSLAFNQAGLNQQLNLANAGFQQQAGLFNAGAYNDFAKTQAGFNQQTELANMAAKLQTMGLNDQQINALLGKKLGITESDRTAMLAKAGYGNQQYLQGQALAAQQAENDKNRTAGIYAAAGTGLGLLVGGPGGAAVGNAAGKEAGTEVAKMATGGIVDKPTHAIIGEDGPEAVVPLSKPEEKYKILSQIGAVPKSSISLRDWEDNKIPTTMGEALDKYGKGGSISGEWLGKPTKDEHGTDISYFKSGKGTKKEALSFQWLKEHPGWLSTPLTPGDTGYKPQLLPQGGQYMPDKYQGGLGSASLPSPLHPEISGFEDEAKPSGLPGYAPVANNPMAHGIDEDTVKQMLKKMRDGALGNMGAK